MFLIFLLIPMLSIKPLHSLTSLNCSPLGVVFLFIFSLPDCFLPTLTLTQFLPEPFYFLKLCGINSVDQLSGKRFCSCKCTYCLDVVTSLVAFAK